MIITIVNIPIIDIIVISAELTVLQVQSISLMLQNLDVIEQKTLRYWVSPFTGLDYWTEFFPFLDKFLCLF